MKPKLQRSLGLSGAGRLAGAALAVVTLLGVLPALAPSGGFVAPPSAAAAPAHPAKHQAAKKPLAGKVVVIDPGHQLGNARHRRQVTRKVNAGYGLRKACNTTGTSTNSGYPEATFNFQVAQELRSRLERAGATVIMTRTRNTSSLWGPCVDARGKVGNARHADLKISIHADGAAARDHGFHVIVSTRNKTWAKKSLAFAKDARAALQHKGFARSNYIGKGTALSLRGDMGTLNLSQMPSVMLELGNMRNSRDAAVRRQPRGGSGMRTHWLLPPRPS